MRSAYAYRSAERNERNERTDERIGPVLDINSRSVTRTSGRVDVELVVWAGLLAALAAGFAYCLLSWLPMVLSTTSAPARPAYTDPFDRSSERASRSLSRPTIVPTPRSSPPTAARAVRVEPSVRGVGTLNWHALRMCENGGSYRSAPGDRYRGAYQFDPSTWRAMGGTGDPAAASRAEQDARALALYRVAGRTPWPICGRLL